MKSGLTFGLGLANWLHDCIVRALQAGAIQGPPSESGFLPNGPAIGKLPVTSLNHQDAEAYPDMLQDQIREITADVNWAQTPPPDVDYSM